MSAKQGDLIWRGKDGAAISCTEKVKVLAENLDEFEQVAQEAIDDAVLMGVSPDQIAEVFQKSLAKLSPRFPSA